MAKFLTGKNLTEKIYDIIWNAEGILLIVSPYIKLDEYFKKLFLNHKNNHKLHIIILFGKNEGSPTKSLRMEDFEFFKQFKNISIVYHKDLHAKYYGNSKEGVVTSINLYDTNFETNLEYGVGYEKDFIDNFTNSHDKEAWNFSMETVATCPAIFVKRPVYDRKLMGLTKSYVDSEVLLDQTEIFWRGRKWDSEQKHYLPEYEEELSASGKKTERPERTERPAKESVVQLSRFNNSEYEQKPKHYDKSFTQPVGYCIRTGVEIPFDPSRPLSYGAYQNWVEFQNADYPENYCHRTGRKSYGKTSVRNPIL